jgi:shikimate kinase
MLIPGSGKSSLAQELKKSEVEWQFVDSDKIRREVM